MARILEASGLAKDTHEDEGSVYLPMPIIWLESADIVSQSDCDTTATVPAFEFCRVTACGQFEYGGKYGHLGAHDYQLRGAHNYTPH